MKKNLYIFLLLLSYIIFEKTSLLYAKPIDSPTTKLKEEKLLNYKVIFLSPEVSNLAKMMKEHSQLIKLNTQPPTNRMSLTLRIKEDIEIGKKLLNSYGYYSGSIKSTILWDTDPIRIQIEFSPGIQYTINSIDIQYTPKDTSDPHLLHSLDRFHLFSGSSAIADHVLSAVDSLTNYLHNKGYPLAKIEKTQYIIDRTLHNLDISIRIKQGLLLHMGEVQPQGIPNISKKYLNKITPWKEGRIWNDSRLAIYQTRLQQTGLFSSILLKPGESPEPNGNTPIELIATEAPPRTISGGIKYSSDQGPGIRGTWEHRNVFGNGENFRITAPISRDDQQILATFHKPAFGPPNQSLIAEAKIHNEKTDAYRQHLASVATGLDRQFNKRWSGSSSLSIETGFMNERESNKKIFTFFGIPTSVMRNTSNDLLNPTKGTKFIVSITPYIGKYKKNVTTLRSRFDFNAYLDVLKNKKFILAGKIALGSLLGKQIEDYPAILRFYAGGGGSVRGYDYQSLGPKNKYGNAIGGLSFSTINFELRIKLTETFGIVPFIDGGNIYEKKLPNLKKSLYWGAGLGFRYYSNFGPIRLDVATPLEDRTHNKHFQIYISIGQSF